MSIFEIIIVICLIIVSCIFCSIYSSGKFVDTIKYIIQKIKWLKEEDKK